MSDPTRRFSNRVENYLKHRPRYPEEILIFFKQVLGLTPDSVIADIGSGTGFLTEMFLKNGNVVFAVEPNPEMRSAAEKLLGNLPGFRSVQGTAEETKLENGIVDFVIAGQAFHWFDRGKCKEEFVRIMKPVGWVVLLWNDRRVKSSFEVEYENLLLKYGTDYQAVDHRNVNEAVLRDFFHPCEFESKVFENYQLLDLEGLEGRLMSSSYVPAKGRPLFDEMIAELRTLFRKYAEKDRVRIEYDTRVFYGHL